MPDAQLKIDIVADSTQAVAGIKQLNLSLGDAEKLLKELQKDRLSIVDDAALRQSNVAIKNVTQSLKELKNAGTQGFDEFGKKIEGSVGPLNDVYSGVRKLANILPGIGISGVFLLAFDALKDAFTGLPKEVDDASKAIDDYNKLLNDVVKNNTKEAATVDILVGKIQSGTLSRQETVKAINELRQIAPDYFGKLNAEKASIEDVTKAYGAYNNQITKTIEAQIRIAEITDIVKQRLTQQTQTPDAAKFISDLESQGKTLDQIAQIALKGTQDDIRAQAQLATSSKFVTDEQAKQVLLQSKIPAGVQSIIKFLQQERDIMKDISDVSSLVKIPEVKTKAAKEAADPSKSAIAFGIDLDTSNFDPAKAIEPVEKKLNKFGGLRLEVIAGFNQEQVAHTQEEAHKLAKQLSKTLNDGVADGIGSVADAIGGAIGSGQNVLKAAGGALLNTLGDLIEQLGKALLIYGIAQEAVQISFESFDPIVAIAAGAAAIVAGAALKGVANKPHALAGGGIVTGPTLTLTGEQGPEAVVPLNRLSSFANNASSPTNNVHVTGEISGTNLKLVLARANKNQGLV